MNLEEGQGQNHEEGHDQHIKEGQVQTREASEFSVEMEEENPNVPNFPEEGSAYKVGNTIVGCRVSNREALQGYFCNLSTEVSPPFKVSECLVHEFNDIPLFEISSRSKLVHKNRGKAYFMEPHTAMTKITHWPTASTLGQRIMAEETMWPMKFRLRGLASEIINPGDRAGNDGWVREICETFYERVNGVGLWGAIALSRGHYTCYPNMLQALIEHWCPKTNTFQMRFGDMSLSLADMVAICGLPIGTVIYDEWIPSRDQMRHSTTTDTGEEVFYFPTSLEELFDEYENLVAADKDSKVGHLSDPTGKVNYYYWLHHFFKLPEEEDITPRKGRRKEKEIPIWREGDPERAKSETYLAAFYVYWLCRFAFPVNRGDFIRREVFVMASYLANGRRVNLANAALANIYRGLRELWEDPAGTVQFPWHYLYAWMCSYFQYIHTENKSNADPLLRTMNTPPLMHKIMGGMPTIYDNWHGRIWLRDPANVIWRPYGEESNRVIIEHTDVRGADITYHWWFRAMLPSYLPFRQGPNWYVEPYYPNRFARQFGFDQAVPLRPTDWREPPRVTRQLEVLKQSWNFILCKHTGIKWRLVGQQRQGYCSHNYGIWWTTYTRDFFCDTLSRLYGNVQRPTARGRPRHIAKERAHHRLPSQAYPIESEAELEARNSPPKKKRRGKEDRVIVKAVQGHTEPLVKHPHRADLSTLGHCQDRGQSLLNCARDTGKALAALTSRPLVDDSDRKTRLLMRVAAAERFTVEQVEGLGETTTFGGNVQGGASLLRSAFTENGGGSVHFLELQPPEGGSTERFDGGEVAIELETTKTKGKEAPKEPMGLKIETIVEELVATKDATEVDVNVGISPIGGQVVTQVPKVCMMTTSLQLPIAPTIQPTPTRGHVTSQGIETLGTTVPIRVEGGVCPLITPTVRATIEGSGDSQASHVRQPTMAKELLGIGRTTSMVVSSKPSIPPRKTNPPMRTILSSSHSATTITTELTAKFTTSDILAVKSTMVLMKRHLDRIVERSQGRDKAMEDLFIRIRSRLQDYHISTEVLDAFAEEWKGHMVAFERLSTEVIEEVTARERAEQLKELQSQASKAWVERESLLKRKEDIKNCQKSLIKKVSIARSRVTELEWQLEEARKALDECTKEAEIVDQEASIVSIELTKADTIVADTVTELQVVAKNASEDTEALATHRRNLDYVQSDILDCIHAFLDSDWVKSLMSLQTLVPL